MPHLLVSGIAELVRDVTAALQEQGATAVGVADIADVPEACADAGPGAFDGYVQLPATFTVGGATAVERVHHFFSDGVLARFPAVTAALPALREGSRLTFVLGVLPPAVATADDVAARAALVRVLGYAARADGPPGLGVDLLETGTPATEIARTALGRAGRVEPGAAEVRSRSYADWRVELLGMMSAQL